MDVREIGRTGLKQHGGIVREEILQVLTGRQGVQIYKEMRDNDAIVGAILFAVDMLIREVSWSVEPGTDDTAGEEAAAFVESCREDMSVPWSDTISEVLSMLAFGWSFHETVLKQRLGDQRDPSKRSKHNDGRYGWRKLPIRGQDTLLRWDFDEEGGVQGMRQQGSGAAAGVLIPIEKGLLFRTRSDRGNPEGRSLLRSAYRSWMFKKRIEEIEGVGIERDLAGLPMAWLPPEYLSPDASADKKEVFQAVQKIVTSVKRDEQEGIVFPLAYDREGKNKLFDFTLVTSGGRRSFDTDKIIGRYDQRIAMTVLADFILLGHESVGSFALGLSKTEMFQTALGAYTKTIADVFNRHAIPRLLAVNGFNLEAPPQLTPGEVGRVDLKELGDYIQRLSGAKAPLFPDDELERYLRRAAKLPEPPEEAVAKRRRKVAVGKAVGAGDEDASWEIFLRIADRLSPPLKKRFLGAVEKMRNQVDLPALESAIRAGDTAAAEAALAIDTFAKEIGGAITELRAAVEAAGKAVASQLTTTVGVAITFDVASPHVATWIQERSALLVTQVTDTTREAIRSVLSDVYQSGQAPEAAAKRFLADGLLGQTKRDAKAIANFRGRLVTDGASEKDADKKTARYAKRKLEDRAQTVADDQMLNAGAQGRYLGWVDAIRNGWLPVNVMRRRVVTPDDRLCVICEPMDGQLRGMTEEFTSPYDGSTVLTGPIHVLCRCQEVLEISAEPEFDLDSARERLKAKEITTADLKGATLENVEEVIRDAPSEHAVVLHDGQVTFHATQYKEGIVQFTDAQKAQLAGGTLTHNHPHGSSFSDGDIAIAHVRNLKEVRAVSPWYDYTIQRPETGWWRAADDIDGQLTRSHVRNRWNEEIAALNPHYSLLVQQGKMSADAAWREHSDRAVEKLAESLGFLYTRSPRSNVAD